MSTLITTQAIILHGDYFREKDFRVSFLSRDVGLHDAIAIGAKKSVSKQRARLESGTITELAFAKGRRFDRITTSEPLVVPNHIRVSLPKLTALQFLSASILNTTRRGEPMPELYLFCAKAILALEKLSETDVPGWCDLVAKKIIEHAGFAPTANAPLRSQMEFFFEKPMRAWDVLQVV